MLLDLTHWAFKLRQYISLCNFFCPSALQLFHRKPGHYSTIYTKYSTQDHCFLLLLSSERIPAWQKSKQSSCGKSNIFLFFDLIPVGYKKKNNSCDIEKIPSEGFSDAGIIRRNVTTWFAEMYKKINVFFLFVLIRIKRSSSLLKAFCPQIF